MIQNEKEEDDTINEKLVGFSTVLNSNQIKTVLK